MKTSKISQLLIVFYFITLTGCSVEGLTYYGEGENRCWTIIDENTGTPISTAHINLNYYGSSGNLAWKYIGCDGNGKACLYYS